MSNQVIYEWSIETVDENGDIIDSSFWDKLPKDKLEDNQRICLVRNEGNERDGVTDRLWAYLYNGILPEYFQDELGESTRIKVPKIHSLHIKRFYDSSNSIK